MGVWMEQGSNPGMPQVQGPYTRLPPNNTSEGWWKYFLLGRFRLTGQYADVKLDYLYCLGISERCFFNFLYVRPSSSPYTHLTQKVCSVYNQYVENWNQNLIRYLLETIYFPWHLAPRTGTPTLSDLVIASSSLSDKEPRMTQLFNDLLCIICISSSLGVAIIMH